MFMPKKFDVATLLSYDELKAAYDKIAVQYREACEKGDQATIMELGVQLRQIDEAIAKKSTL